MSALSRVLGALRAAGCRPKPNGSGWTARCPAHDDQKPSLSLGAATDRVLLKCHAGCAAEAIMAKLGLSLADLFDADTGSVETRYDIRDPAGNLVATHVRVDEPGGKRFFWLGVDGKPGLGGRRASELPLFGIERLGNAEGVIVVEGEKAALALHGLGFPAVGTVTGAAATPGDDSLRPLVGRRVWLWPDADAPGQAHMARIARRLAALGCTDLRLVAWPDAPDGGDAADFVARGAGRDAVRELLRQARNWTLGAEREAALNPPATKKALAPQPLALRPIGELLDEDLSNLSWLVEGLLPAGGMSVLAAKPKTGKSTLARALAVCVAQGRPWLGRQTRQGPVFYLALDRDPRTALREHFLSLGATPEDPLFVFDGSVPAEGIASLRAAAEERKPVLIVIDTMQRLTRSSDVNDYAQVTAALDPLIALARECAAHVLLVHHTTKGERADLVDAPLGSAAITGSVDSILILRRKDQTRTLASIQRYGEDLPETVIALDESREPQLSGTWAEHELTEAANAILGFLAGQPEGAAEADIREAVSGRTQHISAALRKLVQEGKLQRLGRGKRGDPFRYVPGPNSRFLVPATIREQAEQEISGGSKSKQNNEIFLFPHNGENRFLFPQPGNKNLGSATGLTGGQPPAPPPDAGDAWEPPAWLTGDGV